MGLLARGLMVLFTRSERISSASLRIPLLLISPSGFCKGTFQGLLLESHMLLTTGRSGMVGHSGLKYVSLAAVHPLPWVNALRSLLPLSLLHYFFPPFGHRQRSL